MWWKRRVAEGGCCGVGGIRRDRLSLWLTADLRSTDARRGLVPVLLPPYGNMEQSKEMIHGFHGNTSRYVFLIFFFFLGGIGLGGFALSRLMLMLMLLLCTCFRVALCGVASAVPEMALLMMLMLMMMLPTGGDADAKSMVFWQSPFTEYSLLMVDADADY